MVPRPILLVDDEELIRRGVRRLLGSDVVTVGSVEEARRELAARPFGLVCTDLDLGTAEDGLAVLEAARALQPGAARWLTSGSSTDKRVAKALSLGLADRFVDKPWPADLWD